MAQTVKTEWTVRSRPLGYTVESRVTGESKGPFPYRPTAVETAKKLNGK